MKYTFTLFFILFQLAGFSQQTDPSKAPGKEPKRVTFITKVDIANATKDGIYMNGYVVNMDYGEAQKLNGKIVKVSGKVKIVKGLDSEPKEPGGDSQAKQGRSGDMKHIPSPKIIIIG